MSRDASRSHGVLVLLGDGSEDVVAGRVAAGLARDAGTRILAAVILPASGPVNDAAGGDLRQRRQDATAVSGRVRPVLEENDVPFTAVPLLPPVGSTWTPWRLRRALRMLVRRSGACVVVVPPRQLLGLDPETVAQMVPHGVVARPGVRAGRP